MTREVRKYRTERRGEQIGVTGEIDRSIMRRMKRRMYRRIKGRIKGRRKGTRHKCENRRGEEMR